MIVFIINYNYSKKNSNNNQCNDKKLPTTKL